MISEPVLVVAVPAGASEAHLRLSKALAALAVSQFRSPLIRRSSSGSGALNPVRDVARVITVATRDWRGVSSDNVTAAYATEATEASPVLGQPTIFAQQARAFVPFSIGLGQDWDGLQNELVNLITDARSVLDATKFLTGSGTNEPFGVLTGLTV